MPRCKNCKEKFEQYEFNNKFCKELDCQVKKGLWKVDQSKKKEKKDWNKRKKILKDKVKTKSDYLKELQTVFNTYIRLRDINKGCISCGTDLRGRKFDAGHYRSVGGNPQLRFHPENCHGQCVYCNRHQHGNIVEYRLRLIKRVGIDVVNFLEQENKAKQYSIPQLILMKEEYKEKVRKLKQKQ